MSNTEQLRAERRTDVRSSPPIFAALLFLLALLVGVFFFVNSPFFAVGTVIVEGNKYVSVEEIHRIADVPEQINIFRLNTNDIRRRLASDLRLTDVAVSRKFPASIIITLQERKPLAYVACSYGFVQVDRQGMVLAAFRHMKQANVPLITGIRLGNTYIGDQVETEQIKNILHYLEALDEATLNQLSEVNIQVPEQLIAYTTDSIIIRLGNGERFVEKAKLTQDILQEIYTKKMKVEYVDMNYAVPFVKLRK